MAKFKIEIRLVEYYSNAIVVEAENLDEAVRKVEEAWNDDDYLYEKTADCLDDQSVQFSKAGLAKEEDLKNLINID